MIRFNTTAKRAIVSLSVAVLAVALAATAYAAPGNGNGGGKPGGEEPPPTEPPGCSGDFPALAYAEYKRRKNGRIVGTEIVLTNATADSECRVVVQSGANVGEELSLTRDGDTFHLAWVFSESFPDVGTAVVVATFTVNDDTGFTSINEPLPLQPVEVFRYQGPYGSAGVAGIDSHRNRLAFGFQEGPDGNDDWYDTIYHIDDVAACLAQAAVSPVGESCAEPVVTGSGSGFQAVFPAISDDGTTIYYGSRTPGHLDPERPNTFNISLVDRSSGAWNLPQVVLTDLDLGTTPNGRYGAVSRPRLGTYNGRQSLAYILRNFDPTVRTVRLVALDGLSGTCPPPSGTDSCVASGTAELIVDAWLGGVTTTSSIATKWRGPELLVYKNGAIVAWAPMTNTEQPILTSDDLIAFDPVE